MMRSRTVFISRYIFSNSPLTRDPAFLLQARPLIKFESVPVTEFPQADWYFFYSRNGVYFGLRQMKDRSFFDKVNVGTMGKGTAQQFTLMTGLTPQFVGSGSAEDVAQKFLKSSEGSKVVFVRASKSLQSVQNSLKGKVDEVDLITYHNTMDEDATIDRTSVAAFTSPMNVDAYFKLKTFKTPPILIALGKSTKQAIQKYSDQEILMPEEPSEEALRVLIDSVLPLD